MDSRGYKRKVIVLLLLSLLFLNDGSARVRSMSLQASSQDADFCKAEVSDVYVSSLPGALIRLLEPLLELIGRLFVDLFDLIGRAFKAIFDGIFWVFTKVVHVLKWVFDQISKWVDAITRLFSRVEFPKSDSYSYKRLNNNQVTVDWKEHALEAIIRECERKTAQELLENEIYRLEKIEQLSGKDAHSRLYQEIIVEVINRKVVPDFGIIEISFSNPPSSDDPIVMEVALKSVCGYTVVYRINDQTLEIKGAVANF